MQNSKLEMFQQLFQDVFGKTKQNFSPKKTFNLNNSQITILTHLHRVKKCRASDITSLLGVTSGGCTVLTDLLLKKELIQKERSDTDKRVMELTLTPKGATMIEEIIQERVQNFTRLFSDLEEEELDQMIHVFQKLQKKF